jgi:transposase, IS30 family
MKKKPKLSDSERDRIFVLLREDHSFREIAESLERSPNTISEEVSGNGGREGYRPTRAARAAYMKRYTKKKGWKKIERVPELKRYVVEKLRLRWNPDEISGRMKLEKKPWSASKTAIYEWLRSARGQPYVKYLYSKRYRAKKRKPKVKRELIPQRVSIAKRSEGANNRSRYGHWEDDTVVSGKKGSGALSASIERKSRYVAVRKIPAMSPVANLAANRSMYRNKKVLSVTKDNGIENRLHRSLGVPTFFCDPYSSWQKGGIENANKMLRGYFPKGTDFSKVAAAEIQRAVALINGKPRRILGFRTAHEVAVQSGVLKEKRVS